MDRRQIDELRRWGKKLAEDESHAELRPAGRAILLLIDEVERLRSIAPRPPTPPDDGGQEAAGDDEPREPNRRWGHGFFRLAVALGALGALVFAALALGARIAAPSLDAAGPSQGAGIGPALLPSLKFSVGGDQGVLDRVRWKLDGADVTSRAYSSKGRIVFDGSSLGRGATSPASDRRGRLPRLAHDEELALHRRHHGPSISLDPPGVLIPAGSPIRIAGTLEPGASLIADGKPVLVQDGRFHISWPTRPKGAVTLVATDPLRNATTRRIWISMQPRTPPHPIRAVHVTFNAWADPTLRRGVLELIDQGRINAVELDLKDESGTVGWNAGVPLATRIGAVNPIVDLRAAVKLLHDKGVRVIGRLVCFRDPAFAEAAWTAGKRNQVVQTPDGRRYGGYGGFTNFANAVVRRYQIDIGVSAARTGVDEILYDYVRRPDGPLSTMVFPGLKGTAEESIVSFLAETRAALKPYGTYLGASVFGVAATRPQEVAQDIPAMAEHLDYVSAMVYPSHWAPGEYGVANPNAQPYDIVLRSLEDFQKDVRGTGARVVPWLQDFSLGVDYGPAQVDAQIQGARDAGIDEFLLWDPSVTYTAAALATDARTAVFPERQDPGRGREEPRARRARSRAGADAPPDPAERKRLRPDRDPVPRGAHSPLARRVLPGARVGPRRGQDGHPEGPLAGRAHLRRRNEQPGRVPPDGRLDPSSGLGVLEAFSASHHDFPATATFYVPGTHSRETAAHRRLRSAGSSSTASSSETTRRTTSR